MGPVVDPLCSLMPQKSPHLPERWVPVVDAPYRIGYFAVLVSALSDRSNGIAAPIV